MFKIKTCAHTEAGDVKSINQDSILCKTGMIYNHQVGLYIVADGCGGLDYGEEISNLITTYFNRLWNAELEKLLIKNMVVKQEVDSLLENAIHEINQSAIIFGEQVGKRVGSTLSLLLTIDNRYFIKNIGDSRVYLKRGSKVLQITQDQSLVADLVRNKELTLEEAQDFHKKNVLTMCIGVFDQIKTFTGNGRIKNKDTFILCCDGQHNHTESEQMLYILNNRKIEFQHKAKAMRELIPPGAADDNVSVVMCAYRKKRRPIRLAVKIVAALLVISVMLVFAFRKPIMKFIYSVIEPIGFIDIY